VKKPLPTNKRPQLNIPVFASLKRNGGQLPGGILKMKRIIGMMLIIILVIFTGSCKKSSESNGGQSATVGNRIGNIAINITEISSNGNNVTLESYRGSVILLTVSTMWCGPCRAEAPELVQLHNDFANQGLVIIQIIYQDEDTNPADNSDLARWIQEFGLPFTVCSDPDRSTVDTYLLPSDGIPFNVVIDRDFIIRQRIEGYNPSRLRRSIQQLL
jgi:peroxiredoxin